MAESPLPNLPPGYYLDNFETLLAFVHDRYGDLLNSVELCFMQTFADCSLAARQLYVRLISRRGPLFRSDRLAYPEIAADLLPVARELASVGLLAINPDERYRELLALLRKAELTELLARLGQSDAGWRVVQQRQWLMEHGADAQIEDFCRDRFHWYEPLGQAHLLVFRLLFFGNLDQDLSDFVIAELGHVQYEPYALSDEDRMFNQRALVDHSLEYAMRRAWFYQLDETAEADDYWVLASELPPTHDEATLVRQRGRLLFKLGRRLERLGQLERALHCYSATDYPDARQRRVRVMEARGQHQAAYTLAAWLADHGVNEFERDFGKRTHIRLGKRLQQPVAKRTLFKPTVREAALPMASQERVETLALDYLANCGQPGFYAENQLWLSLFGLCFWDILFMPVRGAFYNRFQRGPADLFTPEFRSRRAEEIEARLQDVRSGRWHERVWHHYQQKYGRACGLVFWHAVPEVRLAEVLKVLAHDHAAAIFDRLSEDLDAYRNGFPDLFVFTGDSQQPYRLVEVKGPGDQLQHNQRRWLRFFDAQGIPAEVLRLRWQASVGS